MKKIKLRTDLYNGNEKITSATILRLVASNSPHKPLTVDDIRRRVRILDTLDAVKPHDEAVLLEDADQKVLAAALEAFPWSSASKGILTIIDDVLQAETATPPAMKLVDKEQAG